MERSQLAFACLLICALFILLLSNFGKRESLDSVYKQSISSGQRQPTALTQDCQALLPTSCSRNETLQPDSAVKTWEDLEAIAPATITKIRQYMEAYLKERVSDPVTLERMVNRIRETEIVTDFRRDSNEEGLFRPEIPRVTVGRGSLIVPSLYSFVRLLSHELAHSIDPCNMQGDLGIDTGRTNRFPAIVPWVQAERPFYITSFLEDKPLYKIHSCLLEPDSIGIRDLHQKLNNFVGEFPVGRNHFGHPICYFDHHQEGFCDFIGTEIFNQFLQKEWQDADENQVRAGIKNIFTNLCRPEFDNYDRESSVSKHPSTRVRVDRILLAHPEITRRLGCRNSIPVRYCGSADGETHSQVSPPQEPRPNSL